MSKSSIFSLNSGSKWIPLRSEARGPWLDQDGELWPVDNLEDRNNMYCGYIDLQHSTESKMHKHPCKGTLPATLCDTDLGLDMLKAVFA